MNRQSHNVDANHSKPLRYIAYLRTGNQHPAHEALVRQRERIERFAESRSMVKAGEIIEQSLSFSPTANLMELVERKKQRNDFDVLVAADYSRFARSSLLSTWMLRLENAGVKMIAADGGDGAWSVSAISSAAHADGSRIASIATKHGQVAAIQDSCMLPASRVPFAVDRLYSDATGKPVSIVRRGSDGSEHVLHPESRTVIRSFQREPGKLWRGFRKQPGDHVTLVPGNPADVALVRHVFDAKFRRNWNAGRIAGELNGTEMFGHAWNPTAITQLLLNPIFLGLSVSRRYEPLLSRGRCCLKWRRADPFFVVTFPHLTGVFVSSIFRESVWAWQVKHIVRGDARLEQHLLKLLPEIQ
jgi:hypothetical protein